MTEAELKLADAQQIYDDTLSQKNADIEFFDETKARGMCFLLALSPPSAPLRNCLATMANRDIVPLLYIMPTSRSSTRPRPPAKRKQEVQTDKHKIIYIYIYI